MFLKIRNNSLDISHIKAVIFDMDGTLVETEHLWAEAKRNVAQTLGVTVTEKVLQQYVGRGLNDFINDLLSPKDQKHRLELNLKMQEHALANYAATLRVISGAPTLLQALASAGLRIAICSSGSLQAIAISLKALNATDIVEVVVSGDTIATGKPHPLPYLQTLEQLNVKAKDAIVFEDTLAGLKSATAAGIATMIVGEQPENPVFASAILITPRLQDFRFFQVRFKRAPQVCIRKSTEHVAPKYLH